MDSVDIVRPQVDGLSEARVEGVHDCVEYLAMVQTQAMTELVYGHPLQVDGVGLVNAHRPCFVVVEVGSSVLRVEAMGQNTP